MDIVTKLARFSCQFWKIFFRNFTRIWYLLAYFDVLGFVRIYWTWWYNLPVLITLIKSFNLLIKFQLTRPRGLEAVRVNHWLKHYNCPPNCKYASWLPSLKPFQCNFNQYVGWKHNLKSLILHVVLGTYILHIRGYMELAEYVFKTN